MIKAIGLSMVTLVTSVQAQTLERNLLPQNACSYFGEKLPASIILSQPNAQAEQVIAKIIAASGLKANFEVAAGKVPNAAAVNIDGKRFIVYNPAFIEIISRVVPNPWAPVSVLAHEIGHHLNGHTLSQIGSTPSRELEADFFSGFVLERLGAMVDDAQAFMRTVGDEKATLTHPARRDRLAAIEAGWTSACNQDKSCGAVTANREQTNIQIESYKGPTTPAAPYTKSTEQSLPRDEEFQFVPEQRAELSAKEGEEQPAGHAAHATINMSGNWMLPNGGTLAIAQGSWTHSRYGRARIRAADDSADIKVFYENGNARCSYRLLRLDKDNALALIATDSLQDPDYCPAGQLRASQR